MLPYRHIQIPFVGVLPVDDAVHSLDVLCRLFFHDIQNIVDGDDAHQSLFLIYDRNGKKTVLLEILGYVLLVVVYIFIDVIRAHDVLDLNLVIRNNQSTQRHDSNQLSAAVFDVTSIDGFRIHAHFLDIFERFANRPILLQADVIRCHQTSCTGIGII